LTKPIAVEEGEPEAPKEVMADRAFRVWKAMVALGPGSHTLDSIMKLAELPRASTHRMLTAGVRQGIFDYVERGVYSIAQWSQPGNDAVRALPQMHNRPSYELVRLQRRTGQVALLCSPLLIGEPSRLCVEISFGVRADFLHALTETRDTAAKVHFAPLTADAVGLVIMAHLDAGLPASEQLRTIRSQGFAHTQSPLPGWEMIASPVWRGNTLVGSIALLVRSAQMSTSQQRFIQTMMDAGTALGLRLHAAFSIRSAGPTALRAS
jgi:DNA-binding IclR family transcriptional regulator